MSGKEQALGEITALLGEAHCLRQEAAAPYLTEWRGRWQGQAACVARPLTSAETAGIVRIAAANGMHIVPRGGGTGLVGGQIGFDAEKAIILSLERMKKLRAIDALNNTLTAEAGCILADVQREAREAGRVFPLSLASEGSCCLGGVLATNAGGHEVLRYGTARALTLGLEAVLANGEIWDGLRGLRKDNTGYDLKSLFVGSEGTLGVITAATVKILPVPPARTSLWAGVESPQEAMDLLYAAQEKSGERVSAFEIISQGALEMVLRHIPQTQAPFAKARLAKGSWHVLMEMETGVDQAAEIMVGRENVLLALSDSQARRLWRLRESLSEAQKHEGASLKHDIAVPVSAVPIFLERATRAVKETIAGARAVPFGHAGDGNIHFNVSQPPAMKREAFFARRDAMADRIDAIVLDLGGSVSAEHGIGVARQEAMARQKSPAEIRMMRALKQALDPTGVFNPGKIFAL